MMFSKLVLLTAGLAAAAENSSFAVNSSLTDMAGPNPITSCPTFKSRIVPTNVRQLHPSDIQVMGAMGDSITAGFALNSLPVESRGSSFAIGDKKGAHTLYNFIKHYNPDVIGGASYDVAVTGGLVSGMLSQAQRLVTAFKRNRKINMAKDWKMVTIWIGANNMCPSCQGAARNQPKAYDTELRKAIAYLEANLPRTLVNVMATLPLSTLVTTPGVKKDCVLQHAALTRVECPCAFSQPTALDSIVLQDGDIAEQIAKEYTEKGNAEFAVVYQPGLRQSIIPDTDYLSKLDCFHPSLLGHQLVAQGLWSTLFEPVGKKTQSFPPFPWNIYCPSPDELLAV